MFNANPVFMLGSNSRCFWILFLVMAVIFMVPMVRANQNVTLSWLPVTNAIGYHIYYGTSSRTYQKSVTVARPTSAVVSNLVNGTTYYFAATDINTSGKESHISAETSYQVPPGPLMVIKSYPSINQIALSALGNVPSQWAIEASTNLRSWTKIYGGTNTAVNFYILIDRKVPHQYYRLVSQ